MRSPILRSTLFKLLKKLLKIQFSLGFNVLSIFVSFEVFLFCVCVLESAQLPIFHQLLRHGSKQASDID